MPDASDILRQNLQAALDRADLKARPASEKAGLGATAIRDILEGRSKSPRIESIEAIGRVLGVSLDWLRGLDPLSPVPASDVRLPATDVRPPSRSEIPRDVRVMGASAGAREDGSFEMNQGEVIDYVARPPGIAHTRSVFALYVEGDSMWPRYEPGELIYLDPKRPVHINDFVVVVLRMEGTGRAPQAFLKMLVRKGTEKTTLRQFNPDKELVLPTRQIADIIRVLRPHEVWGV